MRRSSSAGIALILCKPLLCNFKVTLWNGQITCVFNDMVPQRLQVSYLLILGQLAESRRFWNRRVVHNSPMFA